MNANVVSENQEAEVTLIDGSASTFVEGNNDGDRVSSLNSPQATEFETTRQDGNVVRAFDLHDESSPTAWLRSAFK